MSSRVFQSVVLQMKDCVDRSVGVIDADGTVIACNELTLIGERWSAAAAAVNETEGGLAVCDGKTFKPLASVGAQFDYAAFAKGEDSQAALVCAMAAVTDAGLAAAIAEQLAREDPETYGEAAGQLAAKAERINQRRREKQKHENKLRRQGRSGKPYIPTRIKRRGETQSEKQS